MPASASLATPGFHVPIGTSFSRDIYVDTRLLTGPDGNGIGPFHIFAAPVDLNLFPTGRRTLWTPHQAAIKLVTRRHWLGHIGCKFDFPDYEQQLIEGLKCGSAVGKWFIPTREILCGRNADGTKLWPQNIYDLRHTGRFKGSFAADGSGRAPWYLSCTVHRDEPECVWAVPFSDQPDSFVAARAGRFSCRPVRVALAV